ncbi:sigma factor [Corynebacterium sputi]|uniref:sigma factor n=1 Tax=Corynebacterium sputi TaxID=489915 RepID=UPI0004118179|nr:sigma factor [Corynebacterium sputi]
MTTDELWNRARPRLLAVAVNILGWVHDAEDVVSEAWLTLQQHEEVRDLEGWLIRVVSNLAIDAARSVERSRTDYIGPWLPELVAGGDVGEDVVKRELVDLAFVRLLQTLRPVDRATVVLVDVLGLPAPEAANMVGTTSSALRKRLSRARGILREAGDSPAVVDRKTLERITTSLAAADLSTFLSLLSDGCVLWTDSAGQASAARRPVYGRDKVGRFLAGIISKYGMPDVAIVEAAGGPVILATSPDMKRGIVLEHIDGQITGIQIQQNQAKLNLD